MGRWLKMVFQALMGRGGSLLRGGNQKNGMFTRVCMLEESKRVFFLEPGLDIEKCLPAPRMKPASRKHPMS